MNRQIQISPRGRMLAAGGVAAVILAGGGAAAWATADPTAAPSAGTTAAPSTPRAHTPHIGGTVVSVDGSTITVTDHEGFTRVIRTSAATTYADGLTATPAVGTEIHAEGTVDADGVSLDATSVGTRPTPPAGGGHHGPRGDRPAGAPTGAPTEAPTPAPTAS